MGDGIYRDAGRRVPEDFEPVTAAEAILLNRLLESESEVARLRLALTRVFRDRREADKITAECLSVMPELCHTVSR